MKFQAIASAFLIAIALAVGASCSTALHVIESQGSKSSDSNSSSSEASTNSSGNSTGSSAESGEAGMDEDLGIYAQPATPDWSPPRVIDPSLRPKLHYDGRPPEDDIRTYTPKIGMSVRGHTEPDDYVLARLYRGADHDEQLGEEVECEVQEFDDGGKVDCSFEKGAIDKPGVYSADFSYRDGATGDVTDDWRTATFQVEQYYPDEDELGLYVNADNRLDQAWAVVNRDSSSPYLSLMFFTAPKEEGRSDYTARCFDEDGELFGDPEDTAEVNEVDVYDERKEEYLGYHHVEVRSWRIQGMQGPNVTSNAPTLVENPGKYECTVNIDGKPARKLWFTIREDGSIERHASENIKERSGLLGYSNDEYFIEHERLGDFDRDVPEENIDNYAYFAPNWLEGTGKDVGTADEDFESRPFMRATLRMTTTEVNSGVQNQGDIEIDKGRKISTKEATDEDGDPIIFEVEETVSVSPEGKMGQQLTLEVPVIATEQGEYEVPAGDITEPYSSIPLIDKITNPTPAEVVEK